MQKYSVNISTMFDPFNRLNFYFWNSGSSIPECFSINETQEWGFSASFLMSEENPETRTNVYFLYPQAFDEPQFQEIFAFSSRSVILIRPPTVVRRVTNTLTQEAKKTEQSVKCPICLVNTQICDVVKTKCDHMFCSKCIQQWVDMQSLATCPLCRSVIC
jgi:hypothetical protein